ncbi:hypothetical protein Cgig2_006813 [Carnegiea gigantea]|uniref:PHD-type domain-containing protein n=1 Tax=Carnegiea gigantea TaxID=171969 RepID=A0A9Q1JPM5_9CARY|nr:hypothetical protein Cgig2_006813 [Carnegiea gigantea]
MTPSSFSQKLLHFNGMVWSMATTTSLKSPTPIMREKKYKMMEEIMAKAKYAVIERDSYSDVVCEECGSGERPEELLLCDKCDKGFHMACARPIVVRVPIGSWLCPNCSAQPRVRSFSQKKIIDFFRIQKSKGAIHKYPSSPQGKLEFIDLNIFDLKYLHEKGKFVPKAQCDQCLEVIIWFVTKTIIFFFSSRN